MAKVTKYHSGGERVLLFIGGCFFGFLTLAALPNADTSEAQIFTAFLGLCSAGGFYGAFVGKQSV